MKTKESTAQKWKVELYNSVVAIINDGIFGDHAAGSKVTIPPQGSYKSVILNFLIVFI